MHFYMALFVKTLARPNMSDRIPVSYHKASVSHNNAVKGLNEGGIWHGYIGLAYVRFCRGGKAGKLQIVVVKEVIMSASLAGLKRALPYRFRMIGIVATLQIVGVAPGQMEY